MLGLVPGVIFLIVVLGLVFEAIDEHAVRHGVGETRQRVEPEAEILQPLVEAA
jgi:hypothetical protein